MTQRAHSGIALNAAPKARANWRKRILIGIVAAPILFFGLLILSTMWITRNLTPEQRANAHSDAVAKPYIDAAPTAIGSLMLDPQSAQFRSMRRGANDPTVVCGEVNGKNRFGGYAGFRRFIVANNHNLVAIEPTERTKSSLDQMEFDARWRTYC